MLERVGGQALGAGGGGGRHWRAPVVIAALLAEVVGREERGCGDDEAARRSRSPNTPEVEVLGRADGDWRRSTPDRTGARCSPSRVRPLPPTGSGGCGGSRAPPGRRGAPISSRLATSRSSAVARTGHGLTDPSRRRRGCGSQRAPTPALEVVVVCSHTQRHRVEVGLVSRRRLRPPQRAMNSGATPRIDLDVDRSAAAVDMIVRPGGERLR